MSPAATVTEEFMRLADPFRRELLAHCYRMVGSVHDAEDLVQETYVRAWRAYEKFEGRSTLRTWLYRIATTTCLTALEGKNRRPLPTGLGGPTDSPEGELPQQGEVSWLEPVPDAMVGADADADPAAVVTSRESIRLALIAALQHLPPRQRAVLILRDVLMWRAAEVASLLDMTTIAVNSSLRRARAQLEQVAPTEDTVVKPMTPAQRSLLDRYVKAFENKDIPALVTLFTEDAVWEMPPFLAWFTGPETIAQLIDVQCPGVPGDMRMVPTAANGQPAFGLYVRLPGSDVFEPFNLHVLTPEGDAVRHVAAFFDPRLFSTFGLPSELPADTPTATPTAVQQ